MYLTIEAFECHEVAKLLYEMKEYNSALGWIHIGLALYEEEVEPKWSNKTQMSEIFTGCIKNYVRRRRTKVDVYRKLCRGEVIYFCSKIGFS